MTLTEARDILRMYKPHDKAVRQALRFILRLSPPASDQMLSDEFAGMIRSKVLRSKNIDIFNKTRETTTMTWRCCAWKVMKENGYTYYGIANPFGYNHSTVVIMIKKINSYLEMGDPLVCRVWKELNIILNSN